MTVAPVPFALPSPNDLAAFLGQYAGMQIVSVDPHPDIEGAVVTLRTVGRSARRHVAIVRSECAWVWCSQVLEGSRVLKSIEATKWKAS